MRGLNEMQTQSNSCDPKKAFSYPMRQRRGSWIKIDKKAFDTILKEILETRIFDRLKND